MSKASAAIAFAFGFLACVAPPGAVVGAPPDRPPSFIFILGEGHGWASTSVQMDDRVPESRGPKGLTPNLERLAREGMRFSDFYAACPRCTPSRASLFTGISPARLHMTYQNEGGKEKRGRRGAGESGDGETGITKLLPPQPVTELPEGVRTVGDILKGAGYATAHFGKWHVGRVSPARHGLDETDGPNTNAGPGGNRTPNPKEAYAITDRGIAFIEQQVRAGRPFYLQLSHYGGGSAEEVTPETLKEVAARLGNVREKELCQAGVIADMDKTIGRILEKVEQLGIADNTYIIYSADHGSPGRNLPLNGGKGSVIEGGLRVPFIVRGPGIKPGIVSHTRAVGWDLVPTLADLAGVKQPLPKEIEGGSLGPVFKGSGGGSVRRPGDAIVVHFPHYDFQNGGPASAIWLGSYKLIRSYETGTSSLYDLSGDYAEQHDLAKEMREKAAELERRLTAYLSSVNAQMPTPNPGYDLTRPGESKQDRREKPKGRRNSR